MYEEPPPLPFPSLNMLKGQVKDIISMQRNPTTPDVEFKFFCPSTTNPTGSKKPKANNEPCERKGTCPCIYHKELEDDTMSGSSRKEIMPSNTVVRKPSLLYSGHYVGETSFCAYVDLFKDHRSVIREEHQFPAINAPPPVPSLSMNDQLYLLDIYYANINPYYPLLNKKEMTDQLYLINRHKPTYLSPLFFYALFARASSFVQDRFNDESKSFEQIGNECLQYAIYLRPFYQDRPRVSTVLALVILANHMEQTKLPENLTQAWLWSGEAFRLSLDLGIHRSMISAEEDMHGQLCIRAFWLAFITDCTISMAYGRPCSTEEKVFDVSPPSKSIHDDEPVTEWVEGLNTTISLCKIAARVIKFNYSPPPPFEMPSPVKRHNAFLASVDSWLTDIMYPSMDEPESPMNQPVIIQREETTLSKRLDFEKKMFLLTNLILLHRPYVHEMVRNNNSRPSNDICSYAAIMITDSAYRLDVNELIQYHSKSSILAYALMIALRIHVMNAATPSYADKFNADKNYSYSVEIISKLPQCAISHSLLSCALQDLQGQYRSCKNVEREHSMTPIPMTPVDIPQDEQKKKKRKEREDPVIPTIRQYQHGKKRKKGKSSAKQKQDQMNLIDMNNSQLSHDKQEEKEQIQCEASFIQEQHHQQQSFIDNNIQHFIPEELHLNIDPYQHFYNEQVYNQLLFQDDGVISIDYDFCDQDNNVQEYCVDLQDNLGVSIQLASKKHQ
ncbi:hypothetical protein G6F70_005241 [Rhizopus microsporus]|nr:hypothetical protein G6F71_005149 [Rhizopus microsporus]KAG1199081.1 hypothetical protein G6F70_005241 [Rhizopus microsporus]KAG1210859.1 hypothetical protein G6F69_005107 [Rhizopus microsporus]KAG1229247.1 hypothetical protein G6F67_007281 [Rhizopus microsporus]KAG1259320.1 hypothetical protein G6F68_008201 [Rhizopus microsporus]